MQEPSTTPLAEPTPAVRRERRATLRPAERGRRPAWWLDRLVALAAVATSSLAVAALLLAMAGWFSAWVAVAVAAVPVVWLAWQLRRLLPAVRDDRATVLGAVLALGLAVLSAAWFAYAPSHHVLLDRDPGGYVATARWISSTGGLEMTEADGPFAGADGVSFASPGVYDTGGGQLQFQFNHSVGAVLAVADGIMGSAGLFRMSAVLAAVGLLALYSVSVRATGRPLVSLVAPALVAVSLPFLSVARDTFSEVPSFLFLWSGLVLLDETYRRPSRFAGVLGGLLMGATVLARVDGVVYLIVVAGFVVVLWFRGGDDEGRARTSAGACLVGCATMAALGVFDTVVFSRGYYEALRSQILGLWVLVVIVVVCGAAAAALVARSPDLRSRLDQVRRPVATGAGWLVVAGLALAWLVRPHLSTATRPTPLWSLIGELQQREGEAVELRRTYAEDTLVWVSWYLGVPALALAVVGAGRSAFRSLAGGASAALVLVTSLLLTGGAMYLWNPRINPDQIWAVRRFVPAVLPCLAVAVVVSLSWALDRTSDRGAARVVVAVAGVAVVAGAAWATKPVPLQREQHGFPAVVEELCAGLPADAAVLVVGHPWSNVLPQSIRSWCGVPVGIASDELAQSPEALADLAGLVAEDGHQLVVVAGDRPALAAAEAASGSPASSTAAVTATNRLEHTLNRIPSRYMSDDEYFYLPGTLQLHKVTVPVTETDSAG